VTHEVIAPNRREFLFANRQLFLDEAKMPAYEKTLDAVYGRFEAQRGLQSKQTV